MLRIILLVTLLWPWTAGAENYKSYEKVWALTAMVNEIIVERRQLGTDWADTQARTLTRLKQRAWSCVKVDVTVADAGNAATFGAALCMPESCRALAPAERIVFYPNLVLTQKQVWLTPVFMTDRTIQSRCDRALWRSQNTRRISVSF